MVYKFRRLTVDSHPWGSLNLTIDYMDGETPPAQRASLNLEAWQIRHQKHMWQKGFSGTLRSLSFALTRDISFKFIGTGEQKTVAPVAFFEDFQSNKIDLMVATDAYGQGIDKPDIRLIVHWEPPVNFEMCPGPNGYMALQNPTAFFGYGSGKG